jgi:glycine cleavage system H protein
MTYPDKLKYTKDHEWVKLEAETMDDGRKIASVGITDFAQKELGDIVYVEIETEGESLDKGEIFGTVEAVKTVSDLFMPISGEIIEKNESLEDSPETVNSDPYENGWMIKIAFSDDSEYNELMDSSAYQESVG